VDGGELEKIVRKLAGDRTIEIEEFLHITPECRVLEVTRLPSRRNRVFHLRIEGGDLILKVFSNDRSEHEYNILLDAMLNRVRVPRPHSLGRNLILMEFVQGPNLCDLVNDTLDPAYPMMMADWFADLHLAFERDSITLVKSDAKLKNLLLSPGGVVGIDFELAHRGNPMEDIGEMCSQILDTDPMFTDEKFQLCDAFLAEYRVRTGSAFRGLMDSVISSLAEAAHFRPSQREFLRGRIAEFSGRDDIWPFCEYGSE